MFVGELAMTPRISLVAVCCSNASLSSWNSRTFSIAMTAWSAKVFEQLDLRRSEGADLDATRGHSTNEFPLLT